MSDMQLAVTDHMVEKIQAFAELMEDPENWIISVPVDYFDTVKSRLETDDSNPGTTYRGAALCYTTDHDEVWVRYAGPLSDVPMMEEEQ